MSALASGNAPFPATGLEVLARVIVDGIEAVLTDPTSRHRVTVLARTHLDHVGFRVDQVAGSGYVVVDDRWSTWSLLWELAA